MSIVPKIRIALLTLVMLACTAYAQGIPVEAISDAVRSGNASGIARYFGTSVEVRLNNTTSNYSPAQGEMVLRDFFSHNTPREFEIVYTGSPSSGNASFAIGNLSTSGGKYSVYIFLKPVGGAFVLQEIRIQK